MKVNKAIKVSKNKKGKLKSTEEPLLSYHHQSQALRLLFIILSLKLKTTMNICKRRILTLKLSPEFFPGVVSSLPSVMQAFKGEKVRG